MRYKHPEHLKKLGITRAVWKKLNARRCNLIHKDYLKNFKGLNKDEREEYKALQLFVGWAGNLMFPLPTLPDEGKSK